MLALYLRILCVLPLQNFISDRHTYWHGWYQILRAVLVYEAREKWISELNPLIPTCILLISCYRQTERPLGCLRHVEEHNSWCSDIVSYDRIEKPICGARNEIGEGVCVTMRI